MGSLPPVGSPTLFPTDTSPAQNWCSHFWLRQHPHFVAEGCSLAPLLLARGHQHQHPRRQNQNACGRFWASSASPQEQLATNVGRPPCAHPRRAPPPPSGGVPVFCPSAVHSRSTQAEWGMWPASPHLNQDSEIPGQGSLPKSQSTLPVLMKLCTISWLWGLNPAASRGLSPGERAEGHTHGNDPAAGSPTATLLRLLLPLAAGHCPILAPTSQQRTSHRTSEEEPQLNPTR